MNALTHFTPAALRASVSLDQFETEEEAHAHLNVAKALRAAVDEVYPDHMRMAPEARVAARKALFAVLADGVEEQTDGLFLSGELQLQFAGVVS